jgi:glycosyltransferase involved in cell wall biosynthesis
MPLFSVIIPTFGRTRYLQEAVASVLAQDIGDLECIVVDDASPEPVSVPRDARVRVVRRGTNGGPAAARNTGLLEARGRFVSFLDDDDLYTPERLSLALEGLGSAPIALCWLRSIGRSDGGASEKRRNLNGGVRDVILDEPIPHVGQSAIRRDLAPRFDERFKLSEDVEWWLRTSGAGEVRTVPRVGYLLRSHDGPRQTSRVDERLRSRLLLLDVHADYFAEHPKAASYHWKRAGGMALVLGDLPTARQAFSRSLRLGRDPAALWHLARTLRPRRTVANRT